MCIRDRYTINYSSNAYLEIQRYLFTFVFLMGASYTFMKNKHVRIDVISHHLSKREQAWVDIFGIIFFMMPMAIPIMRMSWPIFVLAFGDHEVSSNAGGLVVWPR